MTATSVDSDAYPWAEDLDGIWHRRPAGQPWVQDRDDQANAETVCGQWIPSVHVSTFDPRDRGDDVCPDCLSAAEERPDA